MVLTRVMKTNSEAMKYLKFWNLFEEPKFFAVKFYQCILWWYFLTKKFLCANYFRNNTKVFVGVITFWLQLVSSQWWNLQRKNHSNALNPIQYRNQEYDTVNRDFYYVLTVLFYVLNPCFMYRTEFDKKWRFIGGRQLGLSFGTLCVGHFGHWCYNTWDTLKNSLQNFYVMSTCQKSTFVDQKGVTKVLQGCHISVPALLNKFIMREIDVTLTVLRFFEFGMPGTGGVRAG